MAARLLEMSHEWGTFALRDMVTEERVDPAVLPMPESVQVRLNAWSARWDTTFDVADPGNPKVDHWVLEELAKEGARLWRAILGVLPPQEYQVVYIHDEVLYRTPEDLPDPWRLA